MVEVRLDGWRIGLFAALLVVLVATGRPVDAGPPSKGAAPVDGGSFPRRHEEYVALVANGSERALRQMIAAYRRPDLDPTERGRIVSLACDGFPSPECAAALRAWREKDASEADSWLWYRTLLREIGGAGPEAAIAAASDPTRPVALRAAAIRALSAWSDPSLVNLVAEVARSDLGKDPDRAMLVEALADALASQAGRVGSPTLREASEALLPFLRKGGSEPRTRILLARSFSRMLDAPRPSLDPAAYEALLDRREHPPPSEEDRYAPPRFCGVEGTGDRVVYVVDESGSMDTWLDPEEIGELKRVAEASGTEHGAAAVIPWAKVRTRRDAALELTKASIRTLPQNACFSVVLFGTGISWIPSPFTLVPATKPNVDAVVNALDGPRVSGGTNLHGGLRRALDAVSGPRKAKGVVGATTDPATTTQGPTTVFLLTDGEPSSDDWGFDYKGIGLSPNDPDWHPTAPFQEPLSLVEDVARLNLFRACEIHAVGIGEADVRLLDLLARVGHGKVRRVGHARREPFSLPPASDGEDTGRRARDLIERFKRLGLRVPEGLRELADEEEKAEKAAKAKKEREGKEGGREDGGRAPAAPPPTGTAPAPAPRTIDEEDAATLRTSASASDRREAASRLGRRRAAVAVPDLARALVEDPDGDVSLACQAALRAIAGRGFLDWRPDLARHEKESLSRNWAWWWDLHREAIAKAAEEEAAAEKGGAPAPGKPAPAK